MVSYEIGDIAISLAGHDEGVAYLILKIEDGFVWLCDGKIREIKKPKKKNIKHIQIKHVGYNSLKEKLQNNERVIDEEIKYFLKMFGGNNV